MSDPLDAFTGLLDRFTAAVESGDTAAFTGLFHADGTYDDIFYGEFRGHERLAEMLREHFHGQPETSPGRCTSRCATGASDMRATLSATPRP